MNLQTIDPGQSDDMSRDIRLMDIVADLRETLDELARDYVAERSGDEHHVELQVDAAKAKLYHRLLEFVRDHEFYQLEERHVAAFTGLHIKSR